ncbi:hypothetical protein ACIBCD_15475 [Nocardia brasiliensis]|uniref:hypothetical protein n=1 Tax=Nocardia brasiliensis TaxID=37326 RepID=UPI0037A04B5D
MDVRERQRELGDRLELGEVLGVPILRSTPIQVVWLLERPVDVEQLEMFRFNLIQGPLSRRLASARVPGARPFWLPSDDAFPLVIDREQVPAETVMHWADRQAAVEVDVTGRGWSLATAPVDDGTSVVSFVVSHAITDGRGALAALESAAIRERSHDVPLRRPSLGADLADAAKFGPQLLSSLAVAQLGRLRSLSGKGASDVVVPSAMAFALDTEQLRAAASVHGGTATGLLSAAVANLVRTVRDWPTSAIRIAIPVSRRAAGDRAAGNQVAMAEVVLHMPRGGRYQDLAEFRRLGKAAYASATPRLPPQETDVLVSNPGTMPESVVDVAGRSRMVFVRSVQIVPKYFEKIAMAFTIKAGNRTFVTIRPPLGGVFTVEDVRAEMKEWGLTPDMIIG